MKKVIVKAIFKGQDGSCGYKHNSEYELTMWQHNNVIEIERYNDDNGNCEYSTVLTFFDNWDCVRVIKHIKD